MKKKILATVLTLILTLSMAVTAFADNAGPTNPPPGNPDRLIEAVASAAGLTVDAVKQQLSAGKTLADIAKEVDQDKLADAIYKGMVNNSQGTPTQDQLDKMKSNAEKLAEMLHSGQQPGPPGGQQPGAPGNTTGGNNAMVLTIGSSKMFVKGTEKDIDPGYQTAPTILDGRTFIPIRAVVESLGGTVDWSTSDQKVTITLNNASIVLQISNKNATVNGTEKALDDAPFISATGRTMLPLRFIAENLGHSVNWDNSTKTITIQ